MDRVVQSFAEVKTRHMISGTLSEVNTSTNFQQKRIQTNGILFYVDQSGTVQLWRGCNRVTQSQRNCRDGGSQTVKYASHPPNRDYERRLGM